MLKTFALAILTAILAFFGLNSKTAENTIPATPSATKTIITQPTPVNYLTKQYNNKTYQIYYFKLEGQIELIPNFSQKRTSTEIVKEAKCKKAINGGFYTKEDEPLGLYTANGKTYQDEADNATLLTGFFYLDKENKPQISANSSESLNIFQTGPLILFNKPFSTVTDEYARRAVIIKDTNGNYYAAIINIKDDSFSGPTLSDLPPLLFSIAEPFKVETALNLDGGSSSYFLGEGGFAVSELSSVGSIICIK